MTYKDYDCTQEVFLDDVKNLSIRIMRDDGFNRHISFTNNGSSVYRFDLVTWPGFLCIAGDCGTYVFRRVEDMFTFFRGKEINQEYWGGKLESIDRTGGYKEFVDHLFVEAVKEDFEQWEFESEKQKQKVWGDLESEVLTRLEEGEHPARQAASDYISDYNHEFTDFWEHSLTEYTFHYTWCLRAIVHGIKLYDEEKKDE